VNRALKMLGVAVVIVVLVLVGRHLVNPSTPTTTLLPSTTSTVPTAKPVVASCKGSDFSGVYNQGQGAAGTIFASVTLTKITPGASPSRDIRCSHFKTRPVRSLPRSNLILHLCSSLMNWRTRHLRLSI
jgi:hypothetical protein